MQSIEQHSPAPLTPPLTALATRLHARFHARLRALLDHTAHAATATVRQRSFLLTMLAVMGAGSGLSIAALLSRDPREAGVYAVACVMIGGAIAVGARRPPNTPHATPHAT